MANRRDNQPVDPNRDPGTNPDRLEPGQPEPTNPADDPNEQR